MKRSGIFIVIISVFSFTPFANADLATDILKATGITKIGPGPYGDVVTTLTHPLDYITGIPIIGTPLVKAG